MTLKGFAIRWGFCSHQPVIKTNQPPTGGDVPDKSPVVKAKTLPTFLRSKGICRVFPMGLFWLEVDGFFLKTKKGGPHFWTRFPTIKQHCVQNFVPHFCSWKSGETNIPTGINGQFTKHEKKRGIFPNLFQRSHLIDLPLQRFWRDLQSPGWC